MTAPLTPAARPAAVAAQQQPGARGAGTGEQ